MVGQQILDLLIGVRIPGGQPKHRTVGKVHAPFSNTLAQFEALGVAFINVRDNLDLTTPADRLMFQIIGAMAEFERALVKERVRERLRNARTKGKRLGRPRVLVPFEKVDRIRAQSLSWSKISPRVGVLKATLLRAAVR